MGLFLKCETLLRKTRIVSDSRNVTLHYKPQCEKSALLCLIRFEKHNVSDFKLYNKIASIVYLNCSCVMNKQKANKR